MASLRLLRKRGRTVSLSVDSSTDASNDSTEVLHLLESMKPMTINRKRRNSKSFREPLGRKANEQCANFGQNKNRFYYENVQEFKRLLKLLNQRNVDNVNGPLKCAGSVNTAMRMCVKCGDLDKKEMKTDKYYIYSEEIAQSRTVLCHGCVGAKLKENNERGD